MAEEEKSKFERLCVGNRAVCQLETYHIENWVLNRIEIDGSRRDDGRYDCSLIYTSKKGFSM